MPATNSQPELANKAAWDILVAAVAKREYLTYWQLADQLSHLGYRPLHSTYRYCACR